MPWWRRKKQPEPEPQRLYSPPERAPDPEATTQFNVEDTVQARGAAQAGAPAVADGQRRSLPAPFVVPDGVYGTVRAVDLDNIFVAFPVEVPREPWRHARKGEGPDYSVGDRLKSVGPVVTEYGVIPPNHVVNVLDDLQDRLRVALMLQFAKADWHNRREHDLRHWGRLAGRVEDLRAANPHISEGVFNGLSQVHPKYLGWAVKVWNNEYRGSSLDEPGYAYDLAELINKFAALRPVLDKRDLYQYATESELEEAVEEASFKKSRKTLEREAKEGAQVVLRDSSGLRVVRVDSHGACRFYGRGTVWCISGENEAWWKHHSLDGTLYIIIQPQFSDKAIEAELPDRHSELGLRDRIDLLRREATDPDEQRRLLELYRGVNKEKVAVYVTGTGELSIVRDAVDTPIDIRDVPNHEKALAALRQGRTASSNDEPPRASFEVFGMPVGIEYFEGEERPPFGRVCPGHYGYFIDTTAMDGDAVDVLLAPGWQDSSEVWVVEQLDPNGGGQVNQYKVLVGWSDEDAVRSAFLSMWPEHMLGDIHSTSLDELVETWMPHLDTASETA